MYIPLGLGKFQICVCVGCNRDAATQLIASTPGGQKYYLSVCDLKTHYARVTKASNQLKTGMAIKDLCSMGLVDTGLIFVQEAGREDKCKVGSITPTQRRNREKPSIPAKSSQVKAASTAWDWEARPGRWMRLDGTCVKLSALPTAELISSCIAIQKANFVRITSKISWIKGLVSPRVPISYPIDKLNVGTHEATWKLEEFKQEAEERGLL